MGGRIAFITIGLEADVLRLVDQKEDDEDRDKNKSNNRRRERDAPPVSIGEPGRERQQEKLAGGARGAQNPDDQAATRSEPARRHERPQHHRGQARAESDDDAPKQHQMPEPRHDERAKKPDLDQRQGDQDHPFEAVFVDERRRERRHQAEEHDPQRQRDRYLLGAPAEFLGQRNDERAGDAHAAGCSQGEAKDDGDDRPPIMNAGARQPPRQGLSEHAGSLQGATRPAPIVKKTG